MNQSIKQVSNHARAKDTTFKHADIKYVDKVKEKDADPETCHLN